MTSKVLSSSSTTTQSSVISPEVSPVYFTDAKIKRCAFIALGGLATLGAVALVGVAISGIVTWPLAFLAIPLCVAAFFSFRAAYLIKDYDDPSECLKMRESAKDWSFSRICKEHETRENRLKVFPLETLQKKFQIEFEHVDFTTMTRTLPLQEIIELKLLSKEDLKQKCIQEMRGLSHISDLKSRFGDSGVDPFYRLYQLGIITLEMKQSLTQFCSGSESIAAGVSRDLNDLNNKYSNRQECLLRGLDRQIDQVRQEFADKQKKAQEIGEAATEVAVAAKSSQRDPKEPWHEQWRKDQETRAMGRAGTSILVGVGSLLAGKSLDEAVRKIEEEKRAVIRSGEGHADQLKFDQEKKVIEDRASQGKERLQVSFARFQKTLTS